MPIGDLSFLYLQNNRNFSIIFWMPRTYKIWKVPKMSISTNQKLTMMTVQQAYLQLILGAIEIKRGKFELAKSIKETL